jgi:hypothetical protein
VLKIFVPGLKFQVATLVYIALFLVLSKGEGSTQLDNVG